MNWDDTQYLLALGREKTLRKAAQQLYVDQATVGGRLQIFRELAQMPVVRKTAIEVTSLHQQVIKRS